VLRETGLFFITSKSQGELNNNTITNKTTSRKNKNKTTKQGFIPQKELDSHNIQHFKIIFEPQLQEMYCVYGLVSAPQLIPTNYYGYFFFSGWS